MHKSHYENPPFEIPESWCWTTLENICSKIGSGSTPKGGIYSTEGILFFRSQNVYNNGVVLEDIKYISEEVHQSMIGTEVLPNDLLLNITGGSLGRCAIVPYYIDRGNVSQHVCIIRPIIVKAEYLHLFILSSFFTRTMKITGSGREGLPKYNLENMLLPLPSLSEQARIVDEVAKWNKIIDEIEDDKLELESYVKQIKSKILDLAISGKLVPQVPNDEPAIELLRRINPAFQPCDNSHYENLPFKIPESWCWVLHNSIFDISGGAQPAKSEFSEELKPGYIRLYQIRDYGEKPVPIYIPISTASKTTRKGEILLARYGGSLGKVFIAEDGAYNVAMAKVIFKYPEIVNKTYAYYYYLSNIYQNKLKSISRTAQAGFNSGELEDMYFPLPPLNEQVRIIEMISSLWKILDSITAEL